MSQSSIEIKGTERIGGGFSFVFALDAGFDPYSFRVANGPYSLYASASVPLDQQTAHADSSRAGQWFNGVGYAGFSSSNYGTLTVFRQNSLTLDGVIAYDPMGASFASRRSVFRNNLRRRQYRSLQIFDVPEISSRYRPVPRGSVWQFGGYGQNNASNGAYQFQAGADIPTIGKDVLSVDAIYS